MKAGPMQGMTVTYEKQPGEPCGFVKASIADSRGKRKPRKV